MLYATAAFDRISYTKLFQKLLDRGISTYILRILYFWYQKLCIHGNNTVSETVSVSNGVRQGGILSRISFNIYLNNLNVRLDSVSVGCVK